MNWGWVQMKSRDSGRRGWCEKGFRAILKSLAFSESIKGAVPNPWTVPAWVFLPLTWVDKFLEEQLTSRRTMGLPFPMHNTPLLDYKPQLPLNYPSGHSLSIILITFNHVHFGDLFLRAPLCCTALVPFVM